MYRGSSVGVVVPAYNEEESIGEVIRTLPSFVDRAYVIDDGSTDDTWRIIRERAAAVNAEREDDDHPFEDVVVPIRHGTNRGVGGAIKTGYQRARTERIDVTAVMGGDAQMDPDHLARYLDPIIDGGVDYTKGNRFLERDDLNAMPRFRLIGNVMLTGLTKLASGYWNLSDPQNGYTAISLSALETADIDDMYEYYGYCNDLLVKLNVENLRVADVARPSSYTYDDGWDSHIVYSEYIPRVSGMLLRNFLWRLIASFRRDRNPAALSYVLGMGALVVGGISLLGQAIDLALSGNHTGEFAVVAGAALFLAGVVIERSKSSELERRITNPASDGVGTRDSYQQQTNTASR